MDDRLRDRRIIISGASSGIGAAIAAACVQAGAFTALLARRASRLQQLTTALAPSALAIPTDVTDSEAVATAVARAAELLDGVDALVNVAGLNRAGPFATGEPAHWREMVDTNLLASMTVAREVLPHLHAAGGGDIVTIGSAAAGGDRSGTSSVYAATKAAVSVWSASLQAEVARDGIRIMTVSPGTVRTDFADATPDEALRRQRADRFDQLGLDPQIVAAQVVHVLSQPRSVLISQLVITPMPGSTDVG